MSDQPPTDAEKALAYTVLQAFDEDPPRPNTVRHRGEEIALYTHGQIEGWLRTVFEDLGLIQPEEDNWVPETVTDIHLPDPTSPTPKEG